jgi:hypothetical protein
MARIQIVFDMVSELRGKYPDVPTAVGVDATELVDGDDNPMFLTLPIGQANITSRNGWFYDGAAAEAIRDAVNRERPGGIKGHMRDDERPYRFDIPSLIWVGAMIDETGVVWGKAYIPKTAADVREYARIAKATRSKVGTSIYGTAEVVDDNRIVNLRIEQIDLAHPARVGVMTAAAEPQLTSEMKKESETVDPEKKENPTPAAQPPAQQTPPATPPPAPVTESVALAALQAQLNQARTQIGELETRNGALIAQVSDLNAIAEALGNPKDVVRAVRELRDSKATLQAENANLLKDSLTAMVKEKVSVEKRRGVIEELVRQKQPTTRKELEAAIEEVLDRPYVKEMLAEAVIETMGPNQTPPANKPNNPGSGDESFINIPEVEKKGA